MCFLVPASVTNCQTQWPTVYLNTPQENGSVPDVVFLLRSHTHRVVHTYMHTHIHTVHTVYLQFKLHRLHFESNTLLGSLMPSHGDYTLRSQSHYCRVIVGNRCSSGVWKSHFCEVQVSSHGGWWSLFCWVMVWIQLFQSSGIDILMPSHGEAATVITGAISAESWLGAST